jgi:acetylornithine deacetylase/succinyl-diaminopimelate desuccinylase-like protein
MSVNMINGGDKENQVPHRCKLLIDRRITPSESVNLVTKEIEAVIDAAKKDDPELEADVGLFEGMPSISLPKDSELVKAIQRSAVKVTGKEPLPVGISASTDMAWFAAKTGAQSALFGYGDITMAHGANEFIAIPDLVNSTKSCALIIMDILGVAN